MNVSMVRFHRETMFQILTGRDANLSVFDVITPQICVNFSFCGVSLLVLKYW
jgi:hypothetical protein